MKACKACGFEEDRTGDEFYVIRGAFYVDRSSDYRQNMVEVSVPACPKCGTLQIHEWWIHEDR